ncbi:MAG: hypothetical protein OHK003_12820 [Anaerolineales bacterium]
MEWTSFLGFFGFCIGILTIPLVFVVIFFAIRNNLKAHANRRELTLHGISAPAVILSAWNNYASGGGKHSRSTTAHVTFEVEVQPVGQAPFKAKFKDTLSIKEGEWFIMGPRKEDVGKKIWVAYDPNNLKRMVIDHFDSNHDFMLKRRAFEKREDELQTVLKTGEDATAEILEVEDMKLSYNIEKDSSKTLQLKLQVTPKNGVSYETETVGLFMNTGLHKYTVGKKVTVKIDRADKYKVTLVGAVQES